MANIAKSTGGGKSGRNASNQTMKRYAPEVQTLSDAINLDNKKGFNMSGRGRGRLGNKGRKQKTKVSRTKKRDMLYFVRDTIRGFRSEPSFPIAKPNTWTSEAMGGQEVNTHVLATMLAKDVQYFDCDEIHNYVYDNLTNMYPDPEVPPSPDVILPAPIVGLYMSNYEVYEGQKDQILFLCLSTSTSDDTYGRQFSVFVLAENSNPLDGAHGDMDIYKVSRIDAVAGTIDIFKEELVGKDQKLIVYTMSRMICGLLQTINQPRFVVQSKRDVSLIKRQSLKKATGRFTPDSWNMVTWNVDKPVKARDYDEGTGVRQALHFRRGHFRKSEEHWEHVRWSEIRNRWEKYIHGYEAGHPAFGVKKSYHLPRKGEAE